MDSNFLSLIIGITSSLIATAIFIALTETTRKIIAPWFEDKIYRGVRIDGPWRLSIVEGKDVSGEKSTSIIELIQKADKVHGVYYHADEDGDKTQYLISGHIRDMYLSINALPSSPRMVDSISMLLHIRHKSGKLRLLGGALSTSNDGKVAAFSNIEYTYDKS